MFIGLPKQRVQSTNFQFPKKKCWTESKQVITDKGGGAYAELSIFVLVEASGNTVNSEIFQC